MSALLPLNWQRVSSSEDNSVLLILCISAGELNHLPAFFTCHLIDEANPALCGKLSVDAHVNSQSAGWLISFSLGLKHGLMCFTRYRDRFSAARRRLLYLAGALYEPRNPTRGSHRPPEIVLLEARDF